MRSCLPISRRRWSSPAGAICLRSSRVGCGAADVSSTPMPGSQDFAADPRNQSALIYLNGALVPREQARVSIFDGGFVVGDGVWEGLRLHQGTLLFLDAHLDRL